MQQIEVLQAVFEPWSYLADWQQQHVNLGQSGASAVFVGFMRDFNDGDTVQAMVLEHYPVMTQQQLTQITQQAAKTWQLNQVLLVHRERLLFLPYYLVVPPAALRKEYLTGKKNKKK